MTDYKKTSYSNPYLKNKLSKTSTNKKSISPTIIIVVLIIIVLFFSGFIYFLTKRNNSSYKSSKTTKFSNTKTIYKSSNTQISKNNKIDSPKAETTKEDIIKNNILNKNSIPLDYKEPHTKASQNDNSSFYNKFVSPAREWQPINPGLREATNRYKNLVYGGKPETNQVLNILENMSYYSAYSETRRNPIWVAYRLDAHKGQNKFTRPGKFITDFRTKAKVSQGLYSKTGYDRGHLCPNSAIAARYGKKGQIETFLMSNISPQKPELNRKVWERLERLEEGYANKFDGIWVITGPIFNQHVELLNNLIEIPDAFYKILIDEDKGRVRVLPFIVPQKVTGKEILNEFLTSVDEIERQTNLDFFTPMDDEYENKLESYVPGKTMWN